MKNIKQLTFDITQSRKIKNYAQKMKISEKEILTSYQNVMHIIFQAWKKNHSEINDLNFRDFFISVMKYAEFAFRLKERKDDMKKVNDHVEILREALVEYDRDYDTITQIEKIVKEYKGKEF